MYFSKASCIFPHVTRRKNEVAASLFECFGSDVGAIWPSSDWIAAQHVRRGGRKQGASMSGLGGLPFDLPPFPRRHPIRISPQSSPVLAGVVAPTGKQSFPSSAGRRLREQLRIDDAHNGPQSVLKLQTDQSCRLELDDRAVDTADNKLTHEAPQKGKVPDDHQPVIRAGQ